MQTAFINTGKPLDQFRHPITGREIDMAPRWFGLQH